MALRKYLPLTLLLVCCFFCVFISHAFSVPSDGRASLKKGMLELNSKRYAEAVESLQAAREEFPLLGDYATLYLSDAYHGLGEHGKALDTIRVLINGYPQSTLIKKARTVEIRETKEAGDTALRRLYEAFARDYPDDDDMAMAYGLFLKQSGEKAKATAVFRGLYIKAGGYCRAAFSELDPKDIRTADLIDRASNLMKRYEFSEAEKDLRKALAMDDGGKKVEIMKNLGQALFKQKDYREAAAAYDKANDLYSRARSLYRAGDKEGFERVLSSLLEKNDKKAGALLLASAGDKRRAGDYDQSIRIYKNVIERFPSEEEDALWGIGWAYYLSSDYKKSSETFSALSKKYGDPKYLYWQARSIEAAGDDPVKLYSSLARGDNNFYAFLARMKQGGGPAVPASYKDVPVEPASRENWMERAEAMMELGMNKELIFELTCAAKKTESQAGLLYIISKFYELGEYKRAVSLATKLPYSAKIHRLWYPLAYWDEVSSITGKFGLDPMVALSVMREESRFDADARSVAGARGLMQLMPATAFRLEKSLKLGIHKDSQVNDVKNNISLGVYYLKSLSSEFSSMAHVLAAYNAGEAAVRRWEAECGKRNMDEFIEDIPYLETRNYVKKVLTSYFQYKKLSGADPENMAVGLSSGRL